MVAIVTIFSDNNSGNKCRYCSRSGMQGNNMVQCNRKWMDKETLLSMNSNSLM